MDPAFSLACMRLSFGDLCLDLATRQLLRGGREVPLSPQAFRLLAVLVRHRPRALAKAEIRDHLWPGAIVSESSLTSLIAELRSALRDSARRPRFVRTLHRFGYAFLAKVSGGLPDEVSEQCSFRLLWEDREVALSEGENILGRERGARAWIESASVSRRHARILIADGKATLEDLGSKNGTFLGGRRLERPAPLADRNEIRLGTHVMLVFRAFKLARITKTDAGLS